MDLELEGKVAIVTGASRGLGRAAALARFIDYVAEHDDVWVARRIDVANHWRETFPAEER